MRVLFVTEPAKTLFHFMVPLASALRTAGHEVAVASQPDFAETITQAGLTAVPVGSRNYGRAADFDDGSADEEEDEPGFPRPYDVVDFPERITWDYMKSGYDNHVEWWYKAVNVPMIHQLVVFARQWKPDLVIWESAAFAGSIAAKVVGAAHARLLWSVDIFSVTRAHYLDLKEKQPPEDRGDALQEWLTGNLNRYGTEFSEDVITGHFTIDQLPDPLRVVGDVHNVPLRYVPYNGTATVENWLWTPPAKPRVGLTLGSSIIAERPDGYIVDVQEILTSLADLDIEVVATIDRAEQAKLREVPDNARLVHFAPVDALAPTCTAVIHHAGIGTMATTTLHGVPQLSLPWDSDQPALARKLADYGAGLEIHATEATGAGVRERLLRLLDESSFRERARDLRDEMLAMPTPNELVPHLAELTEKYRQ
ncbi:glycosyl transferase [Actinosynnema sp. ALI-1.44]|uniref:activator-dependent family glycosyltransferase n=1 Tax=Actinosynnema sp. ALI-1.44 TaxID=1933779 RepID=UPI00097CA4AD|nr:activator-dependent family glycosyltransferase [Actinosynnema sp. ALI-1.44]ONI75989.1 glycosyl transferase [Actinosynnema sp. ALI-1.44]